ESNKYDFSIDDSKGEDNVGNVIRTLNFINSDDLPSDYDTRVGSEFAVEYPVVVYDGEIINCARVSDINNTDLDAFKIWQVILSYVRGKTSFVVGLNDNPLCAEFCVNETPGDGDGDDAETGDGDGDGNGECYLVYA